MVKQAPTFGRLLTMALFALSCFGLILFLWLSFGGPVPLQSKGYRFKVAFPEATQLGLEADVRTAGVTIGKVRAKDIDSKHPNRTVATLEIDPKYAPISSDARAILRQKTLLGETYMEITAGTPGSPRVPENGWLPDAHVKKTVELDEVIQALDPQTRASFRTWQQELSKAAEERVTIQFTPHLVPVNRGILTTIYLELNAKARNGAISSVYEEAYKNEAFVRLLAHDRLPDTKNVTGTNFIDIAWRIDSRTGRLVVMSAIDNLIKGTSGQAIQCFNLMRGYPETAGLI